MKKVKAMILVCAMIAASLCTSGISGGAEESLVITRDDLGNVDIVTEDDEDFSLDEFLQTDAFGSSTGLSAGEHGTVDYRGAYLSKFRVYIVTDGSGFQWEYAQIPFMVSPGQWLDCEEVEPENIVENTGLSTERSYKEGYENWFDKYGSDARLYCMDFASWAYYQVGQLPRDIVQNHDNVLDAVYMVSETTGSAYWNGRFTFVLQHDFDGDTYPESLLSYWQEEEEIYEEWNAAYQNWMDSIDADSMTPAQLEASRIEAGVASDQEMLQHAADFCKTVLADYDEIFQAGKPEYGVRDWDERVHPVSAWVSVGDIDRDGELSAADAALLLEAAANMGIGNETGGLSEYVIQDADVNADYEYNSEDAALILAYVAEVGSGSDISFEEFIRNSEG